MIKIKKIIFIIFLIFSCNCIYALSYEIKFIGLKDKEIKSSIKNSTNLFLLKDRPPKTVNALRYRAENDLPKIVKTFQAYGYFDANVHYDVEEETKGIVIYIFCDSGPKYILNDYIINKAPCDGKEPPEKLDIDINEIGVELNEGTNSLKLLGAKANILSILAKKGYPLANIKKYEIEADGIKKTITVNVCIDPGPLCHFGPLSIIGLKDIYPRYIYKKMIWKEGEKYTSTKIKETQRRLTETGLFSSVSITHSEGLDNENELPIKINVIESNHQNITLGVNYATVDGPGFVFGYTNFNIANMGEIINIHGEFAKRALTGYLSYKKPDFLWLDQDLFISAYAQREKIRPYHSITYGARSRITHKINKKFHYSYGVKAEHIDVSNSGNNGRYLLIGTPFYLRYNTSNHLLNPTKGFGLIYTLTPYFDLDNDASPFVKQRITADIYLPTNKNETLVFATRLQLGSIVGQSTYNIPITKLFLGGCEDDLRGYRYKTVGPRNSNGDIIGGRSAIYATFEPRLRVAKNVGVVPFFDMGNIQRNSTPTIKGKWRKSVGLGIRYFTFLGPLRFDVAFPLNKYEKNDPSYRFYVSIGQTF